MILFLKKNLTHSDLLLAYFVMISSPELLSAGQTLLALDRTNPHFSLGVTVD